MLRSEKCQRCNHNTYTLISHYQLTLDDLNDHEITSVYTVGMNFSWNGESLEHSVPNTPLFPVKILNEIGKTEKSLPLGFIPSLGLFLVI